MSISGTCGNEKTWPASNKCPRKLSRSNLEETFRRETYERVLKSCPCPDSGLTVDPATTSSSCRQGLPQAPADCRDFRAGAGSGRLGMAQWEEPIDKTRVRVPGFVLPPDHEFGRSRSAVVVIATKTRWRPVGVFEASVGDIRARIQGPVMQLTSSK